MGVVHHSVYPVWYEVARTDFIKLAGVSYSQMEDWGIMLPLIELSSKYIAPCTYEDELVVRVKIGELSPVKIEFVYEVFKNGQEKPINTGKTLHLNKSFKPINLKKNHPTLFEKISEFYKKD
jgi:acyl-CoA thioester hydrolase